VAGLQKRGCGFATDVGVRRMV